VARPALNACVSWVPLNRSTGTAVSNTVRLRARDPVTTTCCCAALATSDALPLPGVVGSPPAADVSAAVRAFADTVRAAASDATSTPGVIRRRTNTRPRRLTNDSDIHRPQAPQFFIIEFARQST